MNKENIERLIRELLIELGEDPDREGLQRTPARVATAWIQLTAGYHSDVRTLVNEAVFEQAGESMVIVRDIEIYSLCEHHLLPFFGRCHIGYIPDGKVIGVSKLARLADRYARRLQIQERLTEELAHTVMDAIKPRGVGVIIEARHLCMMMRGVEKQQSVLATSSVLGTFRSSHATRSEFLALLSRPHL